MTDHIALGVVSSRFDRDLLEEVLNRSGRREKRVRRLPAHVMMRYVVAMGLYFDESYDEVMRRLVGNLHKLGSWDDDWQVPTASAITQARQRLDAGLIDADDFDDARAGWTPEDVWDAMHALLPLRMERVVTHGDYSLDNILLDDQWRVTGLIDLGRLGVADRYQDLAIMWNCLEEFGPEAQRQFFQAYGIDQADERKLQFYLCLDECF